MICRRITWTSIEKRKKNLRECLGNYFRSFVCATQRDCFAAFGACCRAVSCWDPDEVPGGVGWPESGSGDGREAGVRGVEGRGGAHVNSSIRHRNPGDRKLLHSQRFSKLRHYLSWDCHDPLEIGSMGSILFADGAGEPQPELHFYISIGLPS